MQQNIDLIDLVNALNDECAEYLIVGAYAFAFHGRPRATSDVDIFVGSDPKNGEKVWRALVAFGAPLAGLIAKKKAAARPQDLADVAYLESESP